MNDTTFKAKWSDRVQILLQILTLIFVAGTMCYIAGQYKIAAEDAELRQRPFVGVSEISAQLLWGKELLSDLGDKDEVAFSVKFENVGLSTARVKSIKLKSRELWGSEQQNFVSDAILLPHQSTTCSMAIHAKNLEKAVFKEGAKESSPIFIEAEIDYTDHKANPYYYCSRFALIWLKTNHIFFVNRIIQGTDVKELSETRSDGPPAKSQGGAFKDIMRSISRIFSVKEIISLLLGALITWVFARVYYVRASRELKKEASDLLSLSTITLRALESAGICQLNRDKDGKIVGIAFSMKAESAAVSFTGTATGLKTDKDKG
jgi:hypothetical protein